MRHRPTASETTTAHADDLFRSRLELQIDLRHPLAQLAARMPWAELESALVSTLPPASATRLWLVDRVGHLQGRLCNRN